MRAAFNAERDLRTIPQFGQTQRSLAEQLNDLRALANKFGLYDAADHLGRSL